MICNWVIRYESWKAYNAETEKEAIELFKKDGHKQDEIISIEV